MATNFDCAILTSQSGLFQVIRCGSDQASVSAKARVHTRLRLAPAQPQIQIAPKGRPFSEPDNREEKEPGDRVESLGDFGKATGETGTVKQTNEDDAMAKWDDDGRTRRRQSSLKKVQG